MQEADDIRDIGSRLELLADNWLIDGLKGVRQSLHHPVTREVSLNWDMPWEGNTCAYVTVFEDEGKFRMYYRGSNYDWEKRESTHQVACYAESTDGIRWERPDLGIFEFQDSTHNNIIWTGKGNHNFAPFKDENPEATPDARYKALGGDSSGLVAFKSPDGIHWSVIRDEPVITEGAFDSQNIAFWDRHRGVYMEYHRQSRNQMRDIMMSTSRDFINWEDPVFLDFGETPQEHLYTNAVTPYFRAPHLLVGFPKRFMPKRKKVDEHPNQGISEGVFMTSRDGVHWNRWQEAFIRPGVQRERWWERCNMPSWGILRTKSSLVGAPDELSLYVNENYYEEGDRLRRLTLRMDGFVSLSADFSGGEVNTKPLAFEGDELLLNYSTSAAGSILTEVQNPDGSPIQGFALDDCMELYGDEIEGRVSWKSEADLGKLSGKVLRLRFILKDADLYSLRFNRSS